MNEWTQITIKVDIEHLEVSSSIAHMVVPYGIYIEDYSELENEAFEIAHIDLIDEELLNKDRSVGFIHIYIAPQENPLEAVSFLRERLNFLSIPHEIATDGISEEDWANNWKVYFKPLPVGEKLLILPTWYEDPEDFCNRVPLRIDPGMAFGTGGHATTRLCMETLEKYCGDGMDVLDIGCGSGILSISACLLGACSAKGIDIDPNAVKTARENVELNRIPSSKCEIIQGDLTDKISGKFDIIAANIVADVIIFLLDSVKEFMKKDSVFIISGIIDTREDDVLAAISENGFTVKERFESEGWICMAIIN